MVEFAGRGGSADLFCRCLIGQWLCDLDPHFACGQLGDCTHVHTGMACRHQRCSTEVNQTLHDVWRSPGLVLPDRLCPNQGPTHIMGWYSIYTFWGLLFPNGILPGAKLTLRPSLIYWQRYCTNSSFAAWDKEIQQGGHHVVLPCHIINFSHYLDSLSQRMAEEV